MRVLTALMLALNLSQGEKAAPIPQPPVFAASTQAIYIDVTVERPATGGRLAVSDFRLFDDGVPQAFELIPAADLPVRAILVFDTSGSMKGPKLRQLSRAALDFVSRLGPRDEASLLTFSTDLDWSAGPDPDLARLRASLGQLGAEGATSLYDALYAALILPAADARVLVLLFSDGADTSSWLTGARIRPVAERSNALIHAVAVPDRVFGVVATPFDGSGTGSPRTGGGVLLTGGTTVVMEDQAGHLRTLREVAESTGGTLLAIESAEQIGRAFTSILEEFRARYVLRYDPVTTPAPGWHKLEVRLAPGRKERLRTRSGYWVR
jgi:Ca-activated chloride channel family protein